MRRGQSNSVISAFTDLGVLGLIQKKKKNNLKQNANCLGQHIGLAWVTASEKSCGEITTLPSCNQTAPVASQTTSTTDT